MLCNDSRSRKSQQSAAPTPTSQQREKEIYKYCPSPRRPMVWAGIYFWRVWLWFCRRSAMIKQERSVSRWRPHNNQKHFTRPGLRPGHLTWRDSGVRLAEPLRKDAWESGREKLPELWKVYRSQAVAPLLSFLRIFFYCVFDLILCHLLYSQMISRYFRWSKMTLSYLIYLISYLTPIT